MISIPRGLCRAFPALTRKCVSGRPRGPAPPVVFESKGGTLTIWVKTDDAVVACSAPTQCSDELLVVPMAVIEAAAGPGADPVELAVGPKLNGEVRFTDRGVPRMHPFDAIMPGKLHRPPDPPDDWHPIPAEFLNALHECGRTAARESGRFALTRVQIQGKAGRVVATDGRTALVWGGFAFPFADDLLVPALPVFSSKELTAVGNVRVGQTATYLVVEAGRWQVFLTIDRAGRYPDVAGVVPKTAPTVAGFDEGDVAVLLDRLPGLPGADADHRPVTLALDGGVALLARDEATGRVERVRLEGSSSAGPPTRIAIDRRVLARALTLGCLTARVAEGKPVVFEGVDKKLITVALDPSLVVGVEGEVFNTNADTDTMNTERRTVVRHETNGHAPNGRHDPSTADPPDLLAAAEELRTALADATTKAVRLVTALKYRKKEQRALTQVWSSLKALNLGPEGRP